MLALATTAPPAAAAAAAIKAAIFVEFLIGSPAYEEVAAPYRD